VDPRQVADGEKPSYLRRHEPAHEPGDVELLEAARNGGGHD
jgi:hypothetical protein